MGTPHSSRRHVLGTVALSALAGCALSSSEPKIEVGNVAIGNWRDESVTVTLRLDREGSTVFEEAIEIDSDENELIEQSWDSDPAEYIIMFATGAEGRIHDLSLPEDGENVDGECIDIAIQCRPNLTDITSGMIVHRGETANVRSDPPPRKPESMG